MGQSFDVTLMPPQSVAARGEITMTYKRDGASLDLSSAGRGQQQILLLLAYVLANPGTTLLLDEPEAHLEVVRQRETYNLLSELAHIPLTWARRETENYLTSRDVLEAWAKGDEAEDLFAQGKPASMQVAIAEVETAQVRRHKGYR